MEERMIRADDGAKIFYSVFGDFDKPTLMLIHGWVSDGRTFSKMIAFLSKNFRVVVPDLRGFGRSEKKPPFITKRMVKDMTILARKENVEIIAGHSWGGLIAQIVSIKTNPKILIIISSFAKWSKPFYGWFFKLLLPIIERTDVESLVDRLIDLSYTAKRKKIGKNIENMLKELDLDVLKESGEDILDFDNSDKLKMIKSSTLIIHGSDDRIVPVEHSYYLNEKIKNSEIVIIPNSFHDIINTHAKLLSSIIVGWTKLNMS